MTLMRKIELMGNSFVLHCKLLGVLATFKFFVRKHLLKTKELKLYIKGNRHPIYLRNFTSDLRVFGQLFINEEYSEGMKSLHPKIIMDCGANIGLASLYFNQHFPDVIIYAFEPEKSNFGILKKNIEGYNNIHIYQKAIWNDTEMLNIISNTSHDSFSIKPNNETAGDEKIEGISINNFMFENNIFELDLLKIDIEGAELPLFSKNLNWLTNTKTIIVEIHERFNPGSTEFINNLLKNDFDISYSGEYTKYSRKT